MKTRLITAICTPLHEDHTLHIGALELHIEDQWRHGIAGLLVAGSMGLMQLQTDCSYFELVKHSVKISKGRGEILAGVGDTSFIRTRDRIQIVEQFAIDGVVVLSPYLVKYSQKELIDYYQTLADVASKPLYLYDLPMLTGVKLDRQTVVELSKHPNIRGIKCSGDWESTRQLIACVGEQMQVIPAQPHLIDQLVREGIQYNLDGIFGIIPHLPIAIIRAAENSDWITASQYQQKLSQLLQLLREKYANVFGCCEAMLNLRGISCRIAPAPMRRLSDDEREQLLGEPLVQEIMAGDSADVTVQNEQS